MSPSKLRLPQISTDILWPLIVLAGFGFFASLVPLPPNDFWWHLKIGEIIFTQHHIPTTNMFGWTLPADQPFVYGAWLGEFLLYALYFFGKLKLVTFTRTILIVIAYWLVAYETKRRSGSWRIGALCIGLAAAMTLNNLVVRPQIWSWLPFMAFYILLSSYAQGKLNRLWLLLCPAIMVFWVNAHGAFILGGILVGIFFIGELLRTALSQTNKLSWPQVRWIFWIGVMTGAAMFVNPQGLGSAGYVVNLMTDQPSQALIIEWQTPSPEGLANIIFYASILLLILSLAYSRRRLQPTEALLVVSFLWLAWTGMRYIVWYGMVVMPILMAQLVNLPIPMPRLVPQKNALNTLLAAILLIPLALVQPWFVESFPLPVRYWQLVQIGSPAGPLVDWDNPVAAAEYLRLNPGGRLFNEMGYGSYLIWAIPKQGVFIDPRVELYPYQQWDDYIHIIRASAYNELLNQYGVNRILLHKELQPELAKALVNDSTWIKEYEDQRAQIWYKVGSR